MKAGANKVVVYWGISTMHSTSLATTTLLIVSSDAQSVQPCASASQIILHFS